MAHPRTRARLFWILMFFGVANSAYGTMLMTSLKYRQMGIMVILFGIACIVAAINTRKAPPPR